MNVKDRLPELLNIIGDRVQIDTVDIKLQKYNNEELQAVFKEVGKIRAWTNELNDRTMVMKRLYSETTFSASKHMQDEMESNMTMCTGIGLKIAGALREFDDKIKDSQGNDALTRITRLQFITSKQHYSEALTNHEAFLSKYRTSAMSLLKQQMQLTHQSFTEEECHSLLQSNNISLFVDNIQADTRNEQLKLRDVEARHKEIVRIENSLKEVRDLFLLMATHVNQQQDLINTVEHFANQATDHVDLGNRQLQQGTESRVKSKKKKISLIICLVTGFFIILLVLIIL